jgi:pilus assembly protein CpaF
MQTMSLINSLNEKIADLDCVYDLYEYKINGVVRKITFDILKENPMVVAEVEAGVLERSLLETLIIKNIDRNNYSVNLKRCDLINKVFDFMFYYGELQYLIEDEDISDIDFTRFNYGTIKKKGKKQLIDMSFGNEKDFEDYCKLIILRRGGIINENDSHCRVSDPFHRLRINVSIWPRNLTGPSLNIRKHREKSYTFDDLVGEGMMDNEIANFLKALALTDARILFCGKGAAGKTTCLRAFINNFHPLERVLICESDTELYPDNPACIVQRIKKHNEGGRILTLLDLIRDGLTMSVDTYVIGEIVGNESWTFINAGLTGHKIAGTVHASNAVECFDRIMSMVKTANIDLAESSIGRVMANSLDIIVYLENFKIIEVLEIVEYNDVDKDIRLNYLFKYDKSKKAKGSFKKINELIGRLSYQSYTL